MIAMPYDYFLMAWFALAAASTAYVAYDQFANNPEPTVMKWGFILVTLYMGPFGLLVSWPTRSPVRANMRSSHHLYGSRGSEVRSTALQAMQPGSFWPQ